LLQQKGDEPLETWAQSFVFAVANCCYCFTKWVMFARRQMFVELFNAMMQYEKRHFNTKEGEKI